MARFQAFHFPHDHTKGCIFISGNDEKESRKITCAPYLVRLVLRMVCPHNAFQEIHVLSFISVLNRNYQGASPNDLAKNFLPYPSPTQRPTMKNITNSACFRTSQQTQSNPTTHPPTHPNQPKLLQFGDARRSLMLQTERLSLVMQLPVLTCTDNNLSWLLWWLLWDDMRSRKRTSIRFLTGSKYLK